MTAYYNEIDPYAAQWLRNLIKAGHIALGDVDERSIEDVRPDDLRSYTQCHFFAGIGVWSAALRHAGWPDDRPVWTGSCPCQPFSVSGKGLGFADERHLWPFWHWLIGECRPAIVLGEQVASAAVGPWIDLVHADMEALDYAYGCVPFPSAGVGAPHIRDRNFWLAYAERGSAKRQRFDVGSTANGMRGASWQQRVRDDAGHGVDACRLADDDDRCATRGKIQPVRVEHNTQHDSAIGGLVDAGGERRIGRQGLSAGSVDDRPDAERIEGNDGPLSVGEAGVSRIGSAGPTNGFWRDADWLLCRDGKWRPVEPGTFPLAHGAPARVGRLRAYGNAINLEQAAEFIKASFEAINEHA